MRLLALCLSLSALLLAPALPGKAESPLPPTPPPTVLPASPLVDGAELSLADRWIQRMVEMRERRRGVDTWLIPSLLGAATLAGAGTAALPGLSTEARIVTGVSAAIAAAGMVAALLEKPEKKARWFALAGGAFASAYGAAGFADSLSRKNEDCTGYCYNEKAIGWLGGAFFAQGLALIPLAFTSRGPSLEELKDYKNLPAHERAVRARKLLSRIDRDERKATLLALINGLIGVAVLGTGAAVVKDRGNRMTLLGFAGFTLGSNILTTLPALLSKSRLEHIVANEEPEEKERVLW